MKLELAIKADGKWTTCFDVPNVKLPNVAYLGFTAETGELSDNHDLISVDTKNLYDYEARKNARTAAKVDDMYESKYKTNYANSQKGGWGWFFLKMVMFLLVLVGAYVGFTLYRSSYRGSRF